jgi:hypothetical protein
MDIDTFTSRRKKQLRDKINNLSHTEHEEIFKILRTNDTVYTQNKNGIFFDISKLNNEILEQIERFVEFCINNQVELDEYDKQINECKINNCFDKIKSTSCPLGEVINADNENVETQWHALMEDIKSNEKISAFVSLLENNTEKLCIKRTNTKFINAKKRYSKRFTSDKKNESDYHNVLIAEPYVTSVI